jgi:hypothetical protein
MHDNKYSQINLDLVHIKSIFNGYYVRCDYITSFYVIKWVAYNLIHNALQRPPELSSLSATALQNRPTLRFLIVQLQNEPS